MNMCVFEKSQTLSGNVPLLFANVCNNPIDQLPESAPSSVPGLIIWAVKQQTRTQPPLTHAHTRAYNLSETNYMS